jgi:isoquinoline 1-oxidoreductase alpha subunit
MKYTVLVNGERRAVEVPERMPLLWVLRDAMDLKGTKFGCGVAQCGACTHPLQRAWMELDVPQCGYCQAGQLMAASALLKATPNPTDQQIDTAMSGNVCRCGTYLRIKQAIKSAATAGRRG